MSGPPSGDLARAFEFILRADMGGTRREPFRWGTVVSMPEAALRHDSNYLLVEGLPEAIDARALAAETERIQGGEGLRHRSVMFRDAAAGERLAAGFAALGWKPFRGIVMAHRRAPEKPADAAAAVETDAEALRAAIEAQILGYPWGTPELVRQFRLVRPLLPVPARYFAVLLDGEPASWAEMYVEGGIAQVEAVATAERFRNRGLASAVVLRAVDEARGAGADLVFLCCDAEDWPKDLYRRLGFDEIGRYVKFTRA